MKYRAMKFRVNNPEHSRVVQQVLFDLGYDWAAGAKSSFEDNRLYLFAEENGKITCGDDPRPYIVKSRPALDVSWMDPHLYKGEKTVEVGGKVYRESDVIERCKPLDPVG